MTDDDDNDDDMMIFLRPQPWHGTSEEPAGARGRTTVVLVLYRLKSCDVNFVQKVLILMGEEGQAGGEGGRE